MREPTSVPFYVEYVDTERPDYTCPKIDSAIERLEEIRTANERLRANGKEWQERAEEYHELAITWQAYAKDLQEQLDEVNAEIRRLQQDWSEIVA